MTDNALTSAGVATPASDSLVQTNGTSVQELRTLAIAWGAMATDCWHPMIAWPPGFTIADAMRSLNIIRAWL